MICLNRWWFQMKIIKTEELVIEGVTYIKNTFDNGYTEQYPKPDPNVVLPEPEPTPPPVTNEDLMNKLNDMSGEQMSKASLDAAYREGVNEYQ